MQPEQQTITRYFWTHMRGDMIRNHLTVFGLIALVWVGIASNANADEVDELIDLLQIRDEMKNQYDECFENSKKLAEEDFSNSIKEDFEDVLLDDEDLAILNAIYLSFWSYGCDFVKSEEVIDFYKAEFRDRFTSAEIQELIKYYRTPLGKKLSSQWLQMNHKFGKILADRQLAVTQESQQLFEEGIEKFFEHLERKASEGSIGSGV